MESMVRIVAAVLIAALGAALLRRENPVMSLCMGIAVAGVSLMLVYPSLRETTETVGRIAERSGVSPAVSSAVWKTVAIAIVTRLTSSVCADAGQSSAAGAVETAGCILAAAAALPMLETVLDMIGGLI